MTDQKTTLTDGSPVTEDHRDIISGGTRHGQQKAYVVLSEEERAKGFVRPVRKSYVHVGTPKPENPLLDLTDEQKERYAEYGYVKFEKYPEDGSAIGRYYTQADLDKIEKGCGVRTDMGQALAETYARDPKFYGGTFCCGCGSHFKVGPKGEFVWAGTDERVGT